MVILFSHSTWTFLPHSFIENAHGMQFDSMILIKQDYM